MKIVLALSVWAPSERRRFWMRKHSLLGLPPNVLRFCSRIKRKRRNDKPAFPKGEESGLGPSVEAKSYQYAACSKRLLGGNHAGSLVFVNF